MVVAALAVAASTVGSTSSASTPTTRYAGATRYETAVALSARFEPGVPVVYVASGERFADALAGAPAAVRAGPGPLLLTERDALPAAVAAEVARLDPSRVVVLGGEAAVSTSVADSLADHAEVARIAGPDRYATAAAIAGTVFGTSDTVLLATGQQFPDALSAAAAGGAAGWPVLLTTTDALPPATIDALETLQPARVVIVGGPAAVSTAVEAQVRELVPDLDRWAGVDRYATSVAVTESVFPGVDPVPAAYLATGRTFPDALAGAAAAGAEGAPLVLVRGDCVPATVADELQRLAPEHLYVLGGEAAVSTAAADGALCVTEPRFGPHRLVTTLDPAGRGEPTNQVQRSIQELAAGDLTGDGLDDIVVTRMRWASPETWPISILVNDGSGGFVDRTDALFDGPITHTLGPRRTLLADFNRDGRPDILIADPGVDAEPFAGGVNHLVLSTLAGTYVDVSANLPLGRGYFHAAAVGDVDADGDVDIFLGEIRAFHVLRNDGTGRFVEIPDAVPAEISQAAGWVTSAAFVDVDGDGFDDLVTSSAAAPPFLLRNDGTGRFRELPGALPPRPFGGDADGTVIRPLDLDGDGHNDLLMAYTKRDPAYQGRWIQFLVNDGDGTFRDETAARLPQDDNLEQWAYDLLSADINDDGHLDLAVDVGPNFGEPGKVLVPPFYLNRGDGTFVALSGAAFAEWPYAQLRLVDVDGDDRLDVISAWTYPGEPETYYVSDRTG